MKAATEREDHQRVKRVVRTTRAREQFDGAIAYYLEAAPHMLGKFIQAAERATGHLQRFPGTGSPRYAQELGINNLRFWRLKTFPYAWFYVEQADDVLLLVGLVHLHSDIPTSLQSDT
jgi:toxin ParE1/3/4